MCSSAHRIIFHTFLHEEVSSPLSAHALDLAISTAWAEHVTATANAAASQRAVSCLDGGIVDLAAQLVPFCSAFLHRVLFSRACSHVDDKRKDEADTAQSQARGAAPSPPLVQPDPPSVMYRLFTSGISACASSTTTSSSSSSAVAAAASHLCTPLIPLLAQPVRIDNRPSTEDSSQSKPCNPNVMKTLAPKTSGGGSSRQWQWHVHVHITLATRSHRMDHDRKQKEMKERQSEERGGVAAAPVTKETAPPSQVPDWQALADEQWRPLLAGYPVRATLHGFRFAESSNSNVATPGGTAASIVVSVRPDDTVRDLQQAVAQHVAERCHEFVHSGLDLESGSSTHGGEGNGSATMVTDAFTPDRQRLIFCGMQLRPSGTLRDFNIRPDDTIHVILRRAGT